MPQLTLFDDYLIEEIRKEVKKKFSRIEGESYDEWLEFVRYEVNERIKELRKNSLKPNYKSCGDKRCMKNF
jgi:hypothetical protein|nr:MAG TPA: hypothetical protein [Caudoviricetes sp.]